MQKLEDQYIFILKNLFFFHPYRLAAQWAGLFVSLRWAAKSVAMCPFLFRVLVVL